MSVEQALSGATGQQTPTQPDTTTQSLDDALDAVWSKHGGGEFDDSPVYEEQTEGPARGPDGKFVSQKTESEQETPDPKTEEAPQEGEEGAEQEPATEEAQEGEEPAEEGAETEEQPQSAAPVPSAWQHRKELWEQMPEDAREFISQREDELQRRQSDLGRQASEYKPVKQVLEHFRGLYDGQLTPDQAVGQLFAAQAGLTDPNTRLQTLMQIVESYGAADQLRAVLTGEAEMPKTHQQPQQPGLTPEQIRGLLKQELAADRASREMSELVSRLSADKPLYNDIPETEMVYFIDKAWNRLGNTASQDAVFNMAYDMAVNADPDLRAKAAALTQVKAATRKPVSTEEAKRANSVNVTSTSSGKAQKPDLDKALDAVWEKHANGRT